MEGTITKCGNSFEVIDEWARWIIIPFLISVESEKVVIDSGEHSEFKWITVDQVTNFECVKGIEDDLRAVGLMN